MGALLEEEAGVTPSHEVVHTWRSRKRLDLLTRAYRGGPHTCRDTGEGGSSSDERVHTRRAKKQGSEGPKTRREAVGVEAECSSAAHAHTAHVRHVKKTRGKPPDLETKRRKTSVDECDTPTDEERDVRPWRTEERNKKDVSRNAMKQAHGRRLDRGHTLGGGVLIEAVHKMLVELPMLHARSVESYWAFKRQFQEFVLDTSAPVVHKLNRLYTRCDWEVQRPIANCMVRPAEEGLAEALETLDGRFFGDETVYVSHLGESLVRGPTISENDYRALLQTSVELKSCVYLAESIDSLPEIDYTPIIRDILLRLDAAMRAQGRSVGGKRGDCPQHIKDVLHFLKKETKREERRGAARK